MAVELYSEAPVPGAGSAYLKAESAAAGRGARRLLFVPLHITLLLALQWAYATFVSQVYAYQGFTDEFNAPKLYFSLIAVGLGVLFTPTDNRPSTFFMHFIIGLVLTPSLILYSNSNLADGFALTTALCVLVVGLVSRSARFSLPQRPIIHPHAALALMTALVVLFVTSFAIYDGFRFLNFDFSKVYDLREAAEQNLPGVYGYLTPIVTKSVIPAAIVLASIYRLPLMTFALTVSSVLIFAITSHKSMVFYPVLAVFAYYGGLRGNITRNFLLLVLFVVAISMIDMFGHMGDQISTRGWAADLAIRRSIFTPSLLNQFYYEFFSAHERYYWSHSRITFGLIDSPSSLSPPFLIGKTYFGNPEMSANAGWVGSGLSNAGILGALIYSVILGLLLAAVDSSARMWGVAAVVAITIVPVFSAILSTDLLTLFLTHGMLLTLVLLVVISPHMDSSLRPSKSKGHLRNKLR